MIYIGKGRSAEYAVPFSTNKVLRLFSGRHFDGVIAIKAPCKLIIRVGKGIHWADEDTVFETDDNGLFVFSEEICKATHFPFTTEQYSGMNTDFVYVYVKTESDVMLTNFGYGIEYLGFGDRRDMKTTREFRGVFHGLTVLPGEPVTCDYVWV